MAKRNFLIKSFNFPSKKVSLKTPSRWLFKRWPFQTIICGCTKTKRYCTWWNWHCAYHARWTLPFIRMIPKNANCKWRAVSALVLDQYVNSLLYPKIDAFAIFFSSILGTVHRCYTLFFITVLTHCSVSHTTDDMIFQWDPSVPLVVDDNIELPQLALMKNHTADCELPWKKAVENPELYLLH